MTSHLSLPRLGAWLISALLILLGVLAGTAHAAANTYCNPSSGPTETTTYTGTDGDWGDGDNWSNGQPDAQCDAVIPANATVTLSTTTGPGTYGNSASAAAAGLTINAGATLIVEGVSSEVAGNWSNATTLDVGGDGLTVDQGATLDIEATGNSQTPPTGAEQPGGSANVGVDSSSSAPAPVTNDGTIQASSSDGAWGESLNVGGTLTNAGSIVDQSGTLTFQGQQNLPYLVDNTGSLSIASGASFTMIAGNGSSFTNAATFANQGTATLQQSMSWIQSGGSETGNAVQLTGGETLQDSAGAGSFEVTNCAAANLTGTIPANQTVSVLGGCSGTTLNLGTSGDTAAVVNDGTLSLDAPANGSDGILQGSELDNHGTLNSTVGGSLPLANQLLAPLVNEAGATVNLSGGELEQTAGTATSNAGTVNIAAGSTWLVQGGSFTNIGTLAPQISSATSVGTVNLTVSSKFTAGGTLAPALAGYAPAAGTEFPVITLNGGSVSGTFASVTGGFSADYAKESASSPYVGVIYGATPSAGQTSTATASAASVGRVSGGARKVTLKVSCPAGASSCASFAATATVTEHLQGKRIRAVAAGAKKRKAKTKVVTVASGGGSVTPGSSRTVTLTLNATGSALLARFHKLKVLVVVRSGGKVLDSTTVTITEPKPKRKKKT